MSTVSLTHLSPDAQRQAVEQIGEQAKRHKYGAQRTELDGIKFDSKAESEEYARLLVRMKAHEIYGLRTQPEFPVIIGGKTICTYKADFEYRDRATGKRHIIDVKSKPTRTPVYRLKKKLVSALYDIEIEEVS